MGNRAVVSFSTNPTAPSLYLHWNGGRLHNEGEAEEINADKTADIRAYVARINSAPRCRYSCLYVAD